MRLLSLLYVCLLPLLSIGVISLNPTEYTSPNHPVVYCYPNADVKVTPPLDILIGIHARRVGLDPRLLRAVIAVESAFDSLAFNPNDPSYGLGQVMPYHWRHAYTKACGSEATPETLMDPEINLCYSAHILRYFIDVYGPVAGIDAYNNGTGSSRGYSDAVLGEMND